MCVWVWARASLKKSDLKAGKAYYTHETKKLTDANLYVIFFFRGGENLKRQTLYAVTHFVVQYTIDWGKENQ